MERSKVAIVKTNPDTVLEDYKKAMHLVEYQNILPKNVDIIIKLNLSWTKFYPASSTPPWQLDGVILALLSDGYKIGQIFPVENKTVVTNPKIGARLNKWTNVLEKYNLNFVSLPEVEWVRYEYADKFLRLGELFPEGILIPKIFEGKSVIHACTMKVHGHSITTGAVKNAFGGLLKEFRHYGHKFIHEVLVDLLIMQKRLHPAIFAVMDATVCGDGAGPRTMIPRYCNYILASSDSVAIDAVAAKMMGFDPLSIPYIRMADELGLGNGDPKNIALMGEDISGVNFHFAVKRSPVIWFDQFVRRGPLRCVEPFLMRTRFVGVFALASNIYHDMIWYPTIGKLRINRFFKTEWGRLFKNY